MIKHARPMYPDYLAERFGKDIDEHQLTVLRDDGLYRHLRFSRPDTGMEHFDLITWPGYLHIGGDRDGYTFARVRDMFEFFRGQRINPHYWSEKITDGRGRAKTHSGEKFREHVWSAVRDVYADGGIPGLAKAVKIAMDYDYDVDTEYGAHEMIGGFEHGEFTFADAWEWDIRDWDHHYLWSCHAIQWGIAQYDAREKPAAPEDLYLIWSHEHRSWWGPGSCGYRSDDREAGLYTLARAQMECGLRAWPAEDAPPEVMVLAPERWNPPAPAHRTRELLRDLVASATERAIADRARLRAERMEAPAI